MSFGQKVTALRSFFVVPADAPLPVAVEMMNNAMGLVGEGVLRLWGLRKTLCAG